MVVSSSTPSTFPPSREKRATLLLARHSRNLAVFQPRDPLVPVRPTTDLQQDQTFRLQYLLEIQRSRTMLSPLRAQFDRISEPAIVRGMHPGLEGLEPRILLYSALGDQWTYSSRITYSFMPDGTNVGGAPSALFQTLNANYPTATWEQQIEAAASLWENVTNANLAMVSDNGAAGREPQAISKTTRGSETFVSVRFRFPPGLLP